MTIPEYLNEIEFAAQHVIPTLRADHERLLQLEREIAPLRKLVENGYRRAEFVAQSAEDDPDDVAMATGMHFETYFGDDKNLFGKEKARHKLEEQIAARAFSVESLAGALLQQAKQGISMVH